MSNLLPPLQQQQQQQQQQSQQSQPSQQPPYDGAHLQQMHAQAQAQPPYAASPPMNAPPMNAPPMQHLPHPPPYTPAHPFAYQNGAMQPPPMPLGMMVNGHGGMRYALPPQMVPGGAMASRSANAKQIKRRTKTGCLTCRKRRIKCDEAQPTCRNCQKSKRECLGYDPIFKQQSGPAPIQPAPVAASAAATDSTSPSMSHHTDYNSPQSYASATGHFISAPQRAQRDTPLAFAPSLDPALGPTEQPYAMSQSHLRSTTIDALFSPNDVHPQWHRHDVLPPDFPYQEVEQFYRFHYAPGLDKLFETSWYTTHGWAHMQHDASLLDFVRQCSAQMQAGTDDLSSIQAIIALEARLVWELCSMPLPVDPPDQSYGAMSDPLLPDLLPRIHTLENILTGHFLPVEQIPPPPGVEHQSNARKHNEMHFWHQLGRIASIPDDGPDPAASRDILDALAAMRGVLGLMENRDVLYSLAVARHIGGRLPSYEPHTPLARAGDADDLVDRLETARAFIALENDKGMTQVIQRVCGMAMRSAVLQKQ